MAKTIVVLEQDEWKRIEKILNDARYLMRSAAEGKYRGHLELLAWDVSPLERHVRELDGLDDEPQGDHDGSA